MHFLSLSIEQNKSSLTFENPNNGKKGKTQKVGQGVLGAKDLIFFENLSLHYLLDIKVRMVSITRLKSGSALE